MTKKQLEKKVRELLRQQNKMILERLPKIMGAVDMADYQDDYLLPKIFLTAANKYASEQWRPLHPKDQRTAKNLEYFI